MSPIGTCLATIYPSNQEPLCLIAPQRRWSFNVEAAVCREVQYIPCQSSVGYNVYQTEEECTRTCVEGERKDCSVQPQRLIIIILLGIGRVFVYCVCPSQLKGNAHLMYPLYAALLIPVKQALVPTSLMSSARQTIVVAAMLSTMIVKAMMSLLAVLVGLPARMVVS